MLFWQSFSFWQRGVEKTVATELLNYVIKQSGRSGEKWDEDTNYTDCWEAELEFVVDCYAEKLIRYTQEWIATEAGQLYCENLETARLAPDLRLY